MSLSILSLCFFNRPITIIPFILGLLAFLPFCFMGVPERDWPIFICPYMLYIISFSIYYNFLLVYYYLLSDVKVKIGEIDVTFVKKPLFYALVLGFLWFICGFMWLILTWVSIDKVNNFNLLVFYHSQATMYMNMVIFGGLFWYTKQKFTTEALKAKEDPVKFLVGVYASFRSLLHEKLVS